MIAPLIPLALTMHSAPGAMSILIGSGISRAAGIPTGWEVVLDLVRKVAVLDRKTVVGDPAEWYEAEYGAAPDYAELLNQIAPTSAQRQVLLRGYFEPSPAEREDGLKQPTAAHRAIAKIVANGFVRIILTTNFDRLLERALQDEGVAPVVLASADAIAGAGPLVHLRCAVIKLHGDYHDARIRNTPAELGGYDPEVDRLLDRVFEDHGMIVAGWSAAYDMALCAAIKRTPKPYFPWYWTSLGTPGTAAAAAIAHTGASEVRVTSADVLFTELEAKLIALADLAGQMPLPARLAQARLKRILLDPVRVPQLHDLVTAELDGAIAVLGEQKGPGRSPSSFTVQKPVLAIDTIEATMLPLILLYATAAHFGVTVPAVWHSGFVRVLEGVPGPTVGIVSIIALRRYPASLLLYTAGLAGWAAGDLQLFAKLAETPTVLRHHNSVPGPAWSELAIKHVLQPQGVYQLGHLKPDLTTPSPAEYLATVLRPVLSEFLPNEAQFVDAADKLDLLLTLLWFDSQAGRMPSSEMVVRHKHAQPPFTQGVDILAGIRGTLERDPSAWPPLAAGLFGGEKERVLAAIKLFVEKAPRL